MGLLLQRDIEGLSCVITYISSILHWQFCAKGHSLSLMSFVHEKWGLCVSSQVYLCHLSIIKRFLPKNTEFHSILFLLKMNNSSNKRVSHGSVERVRQLLLDLFIEQRFITYAFLEIQKAGAEGFSRFC